MHLIGSYCKGPGIFSIRFKGLYLNNAIKIVHLPILRIFQRLLFSYKQPSGTTIRVASSRDDGQIFQLDRIPSLCSGPCKSQPWPCIILRKYISRFNWVKTRTKTMTTTKKTKDLDKCFLKNRGGRAWFRFMNLSSYTNIAKIQEIMYDFSLDYYNFLKL